MLSVLVLKSSLITAPTSHSHLPRSLSSTPTISRPQWPPPPPTLETRETVAEAVDGVELDRTARYLKDVVRVELNHFIALHSQLFHDPNIALNRML